MVCGVCYVGTLVVLIVRLCYFAWVVGFLLFALLPYLLLCYLVDTFSLLCVLVGCCLILGLLGLFIDTNLIVAYVLPRWLLILVNCFLGCVFAVLGDLLLLRLLVCWLL